MKRLSLVIRGSAVILLAVLVLAVPMTASVPEILVGALYPLSGAQAPTGQEIKNGIDFGVEVVNGSFPQLNLPLASTEGIPGLGGAKIKIIYGDTQANPEKGMSIAEQILTKNNAVAIIGCYNSAVAATIAQVTERQEKVFLVPDCTNPGLTDKGFKWFFRLTPHDKTFIENMIFFLEDLNKERGANIKTAAIVNENSLWGQDFSDLAKQYLQKAGFTVIENIVYPNSTSEVTSEVQRLKKANPDVVLHATYISDAILFMKTYKAQNWTPKLILANAGGFIEKSYADVLGKDGDFVFTRSVWSGDIAQSKPVVGIVNQLYKERYGHDMNEYSARAFMGVITLADALNRAKSTDSVKLRQALLETNIPGDQVIMAWDGIKFDPATGQNTLGKALIGQLIGGTIKTVWPFKLQSQKAIVPMPTWSSR